MNKRPLIIIGAGGHGKVAAEIAALTGYDSIFFLDDANIENTNLIGKVCEFTKYIHMYDFFVAIGDNEIRKTIFNDLIAHKATIISLKHPAAIISKSAVIGIGVIIMAGAVINCNAVIEDGAIINTCSSIDHDTQISEFVHVSIGAHLAGSVSIGNSSFIGAGAIVINNIGICKECTIGAGSVVIRDINTPGTYVGVPARKVHDK